MCRTCQRSAASPLVGGRLRRYVSSMRTILPIGLIALLPFAAAADHALSPEEAYRAARQDALTIVDVRLPMEWAATGLPEGALGVALQNPDTFDVRPGFVTDLLAAMGGEKDAEIALICARGNRSSFTQQLLEAEGFSNVHDVSEGVLGGPNGPGWMARDLPTEPCDAC